MHKEYLESNYDITILAINPDNIAKAGRRLPIERFNDRYIIGYWFWELPVIPDDWMEAFPMVNEVWAPSRFVQEALSRASTVPVFRIPPAIRVQDDDELPREHFNLPEKQFLFFTACDAASVWERKNPEATIAAFKRAFAPNDRSVGLVLKVSSPPRASSVFGSLVPTVSRRNRRRHLEALKEHIEGYDNIRLIDRILTSEETSRRKVSYSR